MDNLHDLEKISTKRLVLLIRLIVGGCGVVVLLTEESFEKLNDLFHNIVR